MRAYFRAFPRMVAAVALASSFLGMAQDAPNPIQARSTPAWLRSGLIYEVFPRSFSPEGNLEGVTAGLDRLKALGVTIVWLMPIHPVGQERKLGTNGSPYAVRDYYAIAPYYGTKEDLHRLVNEAHRRGMKVIMDMVADHTAFDSVMMKHPDFYQHEKNGKLVSPNGWTDVAALDYTNPALRRYMMDVLDYWVKDFGIDGYRCDAAGMVPTDFWEEARAELDRIRPDILMLAEASKPELMQKAFDIDYAWPLLFKLDEVIEHGVPATELRATIDQQRAIFPKDSLHMMISDDHDEQRALVRYGSAGALAASALMFTLNGVPLLYNGMEAADVTPSSGPALFESLKIYWPSGELSPEVKRFYEFIIPFREQHQVLREGELRWVHNSDEQHVLSYERHSAGEDILVVINFSNTPFRGTVEAGGSSWKEVNAPTPPNEPAALPALSLEPFGFRIFESKSTP
ncbi:alpha-amylase family glycosyl hydrolase [Granulicella sp. S156]|jgi:cyclomaltodextrinase / maltogenic alpha-amylase / neopullulanase|uniref:alpha-amylase family glycosyl hydrolase n=1 Tax=Granulicella sp. S156 TaxID=1747224 RepID=UPI00131E32E0|nr:alpha-amylase family glycosyl hydrolase [Granulicella sp. S156]